MFEVRNYSKSINFLLENAGPVIRYRLHKEILKEEFSYIPPEIPRFENRFESTNNGNSLMTLIYTIQAMLGYGDDYEDVRDFQQIAKQKNALAFFCR